MWEYADTKIEREREDGERRSTLTHSEARAEFSRQWKEMERVGE